MSPLQPFNIAEKQLKTFITEGKNWINLPYDPRLPKALDGQKITLDRALILLSGARECLFMASNFLEMNSFLQDGGDVELNFCFDYLSDEQISSILRPLDKNLTLNEVCILEHESQAMLEALISGINDICNAAR